MHSSLIIWQTQCVNREVPAMSSRGRWSIYSLVRPVLLAAVCLSGGAALGAQEQPQPVDQDALRALLKRVDQLEARVKQLEAEKQAPASESTLKVTASSPVPLGGMDGPGVAGCGGQTSGALQASAAGDPGGRAAALQNAVAQSAVGASDSEQSQSDNVMMERMDVSRTLLRIRGFGDISVHGDTQKGDHTSFSLGQLDLFVTSDVSDKFKFLSEIVFEAGPTDIYGNVTGEPNSFGVDIERYLLQY